MLGVAIGSQFLLRNGGGSVSIPSFRRDFAGVKTLNHGIGPDITFTRTGTATYFDANGTLTTATADVPRFDHDPATRASRGLLIEESRTNSIRNSKAGGSTNGVIGSGGALPTNWNASGHTTNGVSTEIIGTGTESGLAYVDIKLSGTPTSSAVAYFNIESPSQVVAANGQTWTHSAYFKLTAGSVSNTTIKVGVSGRLVGGGVVSGQETLQTLVPVSSALVSQRYSATRTFSSASVERVLPYFQVEYTSGQAIDLTLRIAAPQLEQGAFATSYIPTTSAAVTRGVDESFVTPISSFYNQSEGTIFAEVTFAAPTNYATQNVVDINDNTLANRLRFGRLSPNAYPFFQNTNNNTSDMQLVGTNAIPVSSVSRFGCVYKLNDYAFYFNGLSIGSDNSATPFSATHFKIGGSPFAGFPTNGHIRKIAYYPKRLSNETLKSLTA